jgi:protein phosphatase
MNDNIKLSIEYAGKTDIGPVRSENQDSFGKYPVGVMDLYEGKGQLFIVADGMGGHAGGKIASRMAVNIVSKVFFSNENLSTSESLNRAIEEANRRIFDESSSSDSNLAGMGTTCTVLVLKENSAVIGHVGDSRIYKIEQNKIEQLTEDHTQVNEMLKGGILSRREAQNYPLKTVLARALGTDKHVKVDMLSDILLKEGQSFIICSDGLGKVNAEEILKIVDGNSAGSACEKLIKAAVEKGGTDNITALTIKIWHKKNAGAQTVPPVENKKKKTKVLFFLILILALIIAGILTINTFPFFNPDKNSAALENQIINKSSTKTELKIQKEKSGDIKDPKEFKPADKNQLIAEADDLFKRGKVNNAEEIYKMILKSEPMHYGAMDGLSKIALYYFQKAEELRFKNKLKEALKYYMKMEELQPGNSKVIDLIKLCEYQIRVKKL